MPELWIPGFRHEPGRSAGYNAGRVILQWFKHHDTAGTNSYEVCRWGRPGYEAGLCTFLLPKEGVGIQFCEFDAVCYDSGDWNGWGPSCEVERLGAGQFKDGVQLAVKEDLTEDQADNLHIINEFGVQWGIPNLQYRGRQFGATGFNGHVSHYDIAFNPDGLTYEEWDRVTSETQPEEQPHYYPEEFNDMIWENVDKPLPANGNTPSERFMKRVGTGLVPISQVEAFVDATKGIPYYPGGNTYTIIRQIQICAKAQKSAQSILVGPIQ